MQPRPTNLCIGLTGGIGSGKTTVSKIFNKLGAYTINSDKIVHALMDPGTEQWQKIVEKFGPQILNSDSIINRDILRKKCIANYEIKKWLEKTLQPPTIEKINKILLEEVEYYYVIEIPMLFEAKTNLSLDRTCTVDLSLNNQINRVIMRNNWSKKEAESMIKIQMDKNIKAYLADDSIDNDSDLSSLNKQIKKLHNFYKTLCPKSNII